MRPSIFACIRGWVSKDLCDAGRLAVQPSAHFDKVVAHMLTQQRLELVALLELVHHLATGATMGLPGAKDGSVWKDVNTRKSSEC